LRFAPRESNTILVDNLLAEARVYKIIPDSGKLGLFSKKHVSPMCAIVLEITGAKRIECSRTK
jgi:hypothetical protein